VAEGFRRRLLAMRAHLDATAEASREATKTGVLDQASVGRLSRMDAMQGQQMALGAPVGPSKCGSGSKRP
jgi:DnaK suppressor protein